MAYEHKDNTASAFPNDYKTEDKHPDFKGKGKIVSQDGSMSWSVDIALWVRDREDGTTMFSIKFDPSREKTEEAPAKPASKVRMPGKTPF